MYLISPHEASSSDPFFKRVFGDISTPSQDKEGIIRSQEYLYSLIQSEVEGGIPSDRIVLGGFSQGGSISIFSGTTAPMKLGGIFCLSGFLLLSQNIEDFIPAANPTKIEATPILLAHGDSDPVVKPELSKMTAEKLRQLGLNVDSKFYRYSSHPLSYDITTNQYGYSGMGHSTSQHELCDLEEFLNAAIPPLGSNGQAND